MTTTIDTFVAKWSASGAAERANKDHFIVELCDVLGVPRPNPTTGDQEKDTYVFEKDALVPHEGCVVTVGKVDLYKRDCFILEAKQGSVHGSKKLGTARRGTAAWNIAMRDAYGQALGYARSFEKPVPFLIACDLGYCFDLYSAFDGSWNYRPFMTAQSSRIFLADLAKHVPMLRSIFVDPYSLDPSKQAAKVTKEVAAHIAELAKVLEAKHSAEAAATFLMRCLFTMFAEDVGLLPGDIFTKAIEEHWLPNPRSFVGGVESLWRAMNDGTHFGFLGKLLKFNGGLFAEPSGLPLDVEALKLLLEAARCKWNDVEPAIFGTLLERALDPKERHALGAHFTPRAYVERLVRPTIEDPIRAKWDIVQAEVRQLVLDAANVSGGPSLTAEEIRNLGMAGASAAGKKKFAKEVTRIKKLNEAKASLRGFHKWLTSIRVLDPACGSGNFLYVALDLLKRLEGEVLAALAGLGETQELLGADAIRVTTAQFIGIEKKRWAKEIAELVLWIGYLQWHFRTYGKSFPVPEPVLRDYRNIECRDAVLDWDRVELKRDEKGKPVSRWDGVTMKKSPVTGEEIPDEKARVPEWVYVNPRKAEWPPADFIVGNPPFIGNKRMKSILGDGYVDALRRTYADVSEAADYVMYWWHRAALMVRSGDVQRFGLITTNSITQSLTRRTLEDHLSADPPVSLIYAIPDHPWVESIYGAQVRIAMTVVQLGRTEGVLATLANETRKDSLLAEVASLKTRRGIIGPALTIGPNIALVCRLRSNRGLASPGVQLSGQGFVLSPSDVSDFVPKTKASLIRPFLIGRDLMQSRRGNFAIDTFGLSVEELQSNYPDAYQWLHGHVRPGRDQNAREGYRKNWWLHSEPRSRFRGALEALPRIVVTCRTARHRVFFIVDAQVLAETTVVWIALSAGFGMGVLSSRPHVVWSMNAGGRLGVGNDSRYNVSVSFDPFPFPACLDIQKTQIGKLGESIDAHRKARQAAHADLTITSMYNVLEKLRSGEVLTDREKIIYDQGLVSVLKKIHDDLDIAVFDAYGWPHDLTDEQILDRLVALNAERAEEERNGFVRWLRPEFQSPPNGRKMAQTTTGLDGEPPGEKAIVGAQTWPKKMPEQIAAVRDLLLSGDAAWSAAHVVRTLKGANAADVELVLESLVALGLLVVYEAGGRWWKAAGTGLRTASNA